MRACFDALLDAEAQARYAEALEKTKATTIAQEKIALVKDLLPETLRPNGVNPLDVLYDALSSGLHSESDELCLELAGAVRESLVYLVAELKRAGETRQRFTDGMRRFLEKRAKRGA